MKFNEQLKNSRHLLKIIDQKLLEAESVYGKGSYKTDFIGQPLTILTEHFLNLAASRDTFENPDWWTYAFEGGIDETQKEYHVESQYRHLKFFFFVKLFSVIESQFRILIRKIDTNYPSGRANFRDIYIFVLSKSQLADKYIALYDFCRLNRNVIHNLGVHTSKTQTIIYRGVSYEFIESQEVLIISPTLHLTINNDLLESLIEIMSTDLFKRLA